MKKQALTLIIMATISSQALATKSPTLYSTNWNTNENRNTLSNSTRSSSVSEAVSRSRATGGAASATGGTGYGGTAFGGAGGNLSSSIAATNSTGPISVDSYNSIPWYASQVGIPIAAHRLVPLIAS